MDFSSFTSPGDGSSPTCKARTPYMGCNQWAQHWCHIAHKSSHERVIFFTSVPWWRMLGHGMTSEKKATWKTCRSMTSLYRWGVWDPELVPDHASYRRSCQSRLPVFPLTPSVCYRWGEEKVLDSPEWGSCWQTAEHLGLKHYWPTAQSAHYFFAL